MIGAWLLLPPVSVVINGLPDYSKNTAATLGIILGTFLFSPHHLLKFRPRWFDLPMLLWCFSGLASSLQNGLGLYDGLSESLNQIVRWGLPYLVGRLYLGDPESLRYFAVAMVIGGLAYVPPCLWEIQMSPQLMHDIYGIGTWGGMRLGGFRPNVFFKTGLELGLWMTAASLAGWWLWRCGTIKKIGRFSFGSLLLPALLGTTILCRSTGALVLLAGGVLTLWLSIRFRTRWLLTALLLVGPVYVAIRVPNLWSGQQAVDLATALVGEERAQSLEYRFNSENLLAQRALEQPIFGWGGWDRNVVFLDDDHEYRDANHMVMMDGLWIITLGTKGFFGLTLLYLALITPAALFIRRFPVRLWNDPRVAAGSLATTLLGLYIVDCLMNGFPNITYVTLAGGLISLDPKQLRSNPAGRPEATGRESQERSQSSTTSWAGLSSRMDTMTRPKPVGSKR